MSAPPPPPPSTPSPAAPADWGADHLHLHRLLRRQPDLLPAGSPLLLAVSGGQDSMALVGLLSGLRRLHGWTLHLWHGDHRWRAESEQQARELEAWAGQRGLPISVDTWQDAPDGGPREAPARQWRYDRLRALASDLQVARVVTGHTASDRAETLLLNLARGSHRRGLASLRRRRPLSGGIALVRPLLGIRRRDTARICRELGLPVWPDPSNHDPRFSRNRVRGEVLPVLEALHPGAEGRLAELAEQLAEEEDAAGELLDLALAPLIARGPGEIGDQALRRRPLTRLERANQRLLLQHWLEARTGRRLSRRGLDSLLDRLAPARGPGQADLAGGWRLHWLRTTLWLSHDADRPPDDRHP
ncbi:MULTISPECIES: tRNA lysidine(34) synthetase TilS [Aphanothece]|uniref:tRNA lysidine(34) synthetase TilS n=1 Tax=Aphanothece TaxID=1121 RepID=UPI00398F71DF